MTVELIGVRDFSEIEARIEDRPIGLVGRLTAKSLTALKDAGSETMVTYSVD